MSGWAQECPRCDELVYESNMENVNGTLYCDICAESEKEEQEERKQVTDGKLRRCYVCAKNKAAELFCERMTGWMCQECSHIEEVSRLGYCDRACKICKGNIKVGESIESKLGRRTA